MERMNYSILVLLICITIPFSGSGQGVSGASIIGDWAFDYEASMALTDEGARSFYGKMESSQKERIKGAYRNRRITFGPGGRFLQALPNGKVQEATWSLEGVNGISVSGASGHGVRFRIKRADGNVLIIMPQDANGKSANMLFPQWYLKRI